MDSKELLLRTLYIAFVEIRSKADTSSSSEIFSIADLIHTIPLEINNAGVDAAAFDVILKSLQERANSRGRSDLLENLISNAKKGARLE